MGMLENGTWTPTHNESWRTKWYQEQGMKDLDSGNYGEALRKMVVLGGMSPDTFAQLHNIKNPTQAVVPEDITTYLEHANKQTELNNNTDAYVTKQAYDTYYNPALAPIAFSNPNSMVAKLWQDRYVTPSQAKWQKQMQEEQRYKDSFTQMQEGMARNPNNAATYQKNLEREQQQYAQWQKERGFTPTYSFQKPAPVSAVASVGGMMGPTQAAAAPATPATVQAPKLPPTVGDTSAWKAQSMFKV